MTVLDTPYNIEKITTLIWEVGTDSERKHNGDYERETNILKQLERISYPLGTSTPFTSKVNANSASLHLFLALSLKCIEVVLSYLILEIKAATTILDMCEVVIGFELAFSSDT